MSVDVLVIGAGPVGLTMAAELARFGVTVRIVEKAPERTDKSKALVIWSRTLELINRMGCAQSFISAGLKVVAANIVAGDKPLARVNLDQLPTPFPYALMLPQSETERLMEEHLQTFGVTVERQVELLHFSQAGETVSATLKHADGSNEVVQASWLIGCDGAHSTVRHGLGLQFEGSTLPSDWVLADAHLDGQGFKPDELSLFWDQAGVLALFPISPGRYRMIADVGDATTQTPRPDPTLEEIQTLLDQRGPGGIKISSPIWLAAFRINERKVADYRAGRVFVAGDAAHIHSPAGGQGMNTGMQDACNLAWKLALVVKGVAGNEPLLNSYSIERSAVGQQVLTDAGRLTTLAILRGGVLQSIRNHMAALAFGLSPVRNAMANKLAELSVGYPHSPLTGKSHPARGGPAAGERAPVLDTNNPVGSGTTPRFALFANDAAEIGEIIKKYADLLESKVRAPFNEHGIWLVRPDGYVALAVGDKDLAEVEAYLGQLAK